MVEVKIGLYVRNSAQGMKLFVEVDINTKTKSNF